MEGNNSFRRKYRWRKKERIQSPKYRRKNTGLILRVLEIVAMLLPIVQVNPATYFSFFRYFYAKNAEKFYDVPKFYFYDTKLDLTILIIFLVIYAFIWAAPLMIKKVYAKEEMPWLVRLTYSFLLAFGLFFLSLSFCVYYLIDEVKISGYDRLMLIICISYSLVAFLMYNYIFKIDLDKEGSRIILPPKFFPDKTREYKLIDIMAILYAIVTVVACMLLIILESTFSPFDPENKLNYELVLEEQVSGEKVSDVQKEYRVIVSHYKDSVVLMDGIEVENKEKKDPILMINTDHYQIEPLDQKTIKLKDFSEVTPIKTCKE